MGGGEDESEGGEHRMETGGDWDHPYPPVGIWDPTNRTEKEKRPCPQSDRKSPTKV